MLSVTSARLACSTCGRQYQHSSHLRRHESTHLGSTQFRCTSCSKAFARRDVWRKHSLKCSSDGNHQALPTAKRGQKPRACDGCFRSRLACNTESPCSRCLSRQLECTYDRLPGHESTTPTSTASPSSATDESAKTSISFLLNLTDPTADSMVDCLLLDHIEPAGAEPVVGSGSEFGLLDIFQDDFMIDERLFPWNLGGLHGWPEPEPTTFGGLGSGINLVPIEREPSLTRIIDDLHALHYTLLTTETGYDGTFDLTLAGRVFTTENRVAFVDGYFRTTHPDFPFTHRPSFHPATASPRLLLALFLCGSMYIPPQDGVSSSRSFFRIAEEYVFRTLEEHLGRSGRPAETTQLYEALQAALLVHCLQYSIKCETTRRRNRVLRLPTLVSAVRVLGLTCVRHGSGEPPRWEDFIRDETKLRLATWTLLADWQQGGMFHVPPLMTIHEMKCDFPCLPELWEAESAAEFHALAAAKGPDSWQRSASLRQAVESLMSDQWEGIESFPLRHTTIHDLNLLVYALHTTGRAAMLMALLPSSISSLSRAASRWQDLWQVAAGRLSPNELRRSGLARHGPELCWLARKLAEAVVSGEKRLIESAYMQKVGHESIDELHALIKGFRDL